MHKIQYILPINNIITSTIILLKFYDHNIQFIIW